jgi:hypothetical protein
MNRTSNARKQNSAAISHLSLLTDCQMALAVTSGLSRTARPVGWSLTATNTQDQVTSKRGGPSPYIGLSSSGYYYYYNLCTHILCNRPTFFLDLSRLAFDEVIASSWTIAVGFK